MNIVVVSDTHMPKKAKELPPRLLKDLKSADLIIHAGDWQTISVFKELSKYARVVGVFGNVDGPDIKSHFKEKLIIPICDFKIGVVHGHGQKWTTEKRALAAFKEDHVDCIIFGHSHIPLIKKVEGMLLFNPGSATDKRKQTHFSYGILHIGKSIEAEHVFYETKN
ncbi:metallophosphoesterase family protein [Alkalihalobacterium elongatum]|uniref:metallophosphoesterase family protein n=1 Tax=Alkalihalobacterium elongatum TaxID=2675466 RepID=UPI001C1F9057|nr:metallophosphoesterase [Alkalihalobacterium elongatum]